MIPIILTVLFLSWLNFSPGSWLTGWDNLHPEFNFAINITRSLFAVWQEYQGLGLLGGMAHASDLPRQLILMIASIFLPENFLRQLYFLLMLAVGPAGVYLLVKKGIFQEAKAANLAGTFAGLFYLLNLATMQVFYVPFSAFATHYGLLPWLFLTTFCYIKKPSHKNLFWLVLANILAVPQAYVPTIFLVYIFFLTLSLIVLKKEFQNVLAVTFAVNAFWLLPFLFFVLNNIPVTVNAKINQMSTENNLIKSKEFGNLQNVALLQGFWFDTTDFQNQRFSYLFEPWKKHINNPAIAFLGYTAFATVILGILFALRQKNSRLYPFLIIFTISFTLLANNTPPFSWIDSLFYKIPLFAQIFRFSFTKFSVFAALSYSIFFGAGIVFLSKQKLAKRLPQLAIQTIAFAALAVLMLPAFEGKLFYKNERVNIPQEYFQVFDFFRKQGKNERIADFPQQTFWGWYFYNWGYSGSGFLWYGIKQPILSRTFDVWSAKNENYYWEVSYAIYSKNQQLFENVFEKYNINWVLFDKNVINPTSSRALYLNELEEMLEKSDKFSLTAAFGNIKIYKVNLANQPNNFILLYDNLPTVMPTYKWNNFDAAYNNIGNYISAVDKNGHLWLAGSYFYPFRSIFTGKEQDQIEFTLEEGQDIFLLTAKVPHEYAGYEIKIPKNIERELVWVDPQNAGNIRYLKSNVSKNEDTVEIVIPKMNGLLTTTSTNPDQTLWLSNLPCSLSYLISIQSQNTGGRSIIFWLENLTSKKADIETKLPKTSQVTTSYFIQPPMTPDGLGYVLHFDNTSVGNEKTVNEVRKVSIQPFPYKLVTGLYLAKPGVEQITKSAANAPANVFHPNPAIYKVKVSGQEKILALSQSFDSGWQAYKVKDGIPVFLAPFFGKKLKEHFLVNNWANGWRLDAGKDIEIVVVYLPQYLEFLGFGLFAILPLVLFWPQVFRLDRIVRVFKFRYNLG